MDISLHNITEWRCWFDSLQDDIADDKELRNMNSESLTVARPSQHASRKSANIFHAHTYNLQRGSRTQARTHGRGRANKFTFKRYK